MSKLSLDQVKELSEISNRETKAAGVFIAAMGFDEAKVGRYNHGELTAMFDGIITNATEANLPLSAVIPPSLIALKENLDPSALPYLLDSIQCGIAQYRGVHGGDMPSASLVASAISQADFIHHHANAANTDGMFDSVADALGVNAQATLKEMMRTANFAKDEGMLDGVNHGQHAAIADVPSLAMVIITTTIAAALPVVQYLPNPRGTQTVPLVYVRQSANMDYGKTNKNAVVDGVEAATQYFDNVHRIKFTSTDNITWTATVKRRSDKTTLLGVGDALLPILYGLTDYSINGQLFAEDGATQTTASALSGVQQISPTVRDFKVGTVTGVNLTSGTVNVETSVVTLVFNKAIPADSRIIGNFIGNFEATDASGNDQLVPPSTNINITYEAISAGPIRSKLAVTLEALSQMQNELGLDPRAAFVAVFTAKLMLEQNIRLLTEAYERALGSSKILVVDLSRGTDMTQAFNNTSAYASEVLPAIEEAKRNIIADVQAQPVGFDIYVTGKMSTLVKTLADDTNFIPTAVPHGLPNQLIRLGSRGSDHFYYIPPTASVLSEKEVTINNKAVMESDTLIVPRHDQAAKSPFIGHIAVPITTQDLTSEAFKKGVTVFGRMACKLNPNERFGNQVWVLKVRNLPASVATAG